MRHLRNKPSKETWYIDRLPRKQPVWQKRVDLTGSRGTKPEVVGHKRRAVARDCRWLKEENLQGPAEEFIESQGAILRLKYSTWSWAPLVSFLLLGVISLENECNQQCLATVAVKSPRKLGYFIRYPPFLPELCASAVEAPALPRARHHGPV